MINKITQYVQENKDILLSLIQRIVAIDSVMDDVSDTEPFGKGPKKALQEALKIAQELGFETTVVDNAMGYAKYGSSSNYLGIFGHLDVVEVGAGWTYPPFGGVIDKGRMYGRGVLDNKAPIMTNLFALYLLKEMGITFKNEVRIVFGTNEEKGMNDVDIYLNKEKPPYFGWTPDCKFPVVYGERGRVVYRIYQDKANTSDFFAFVNDYFLKSTNDGKSLGIDYSDKDFGSLIMRGYQLGKDDKGSYFQFSISYPNSCTKDILMRQIESMLFKGLSLELMTNWNPVLFDKKSKYVTKLNDCYNMVCNSDLEPVTTTGGTYAKRIPNIVAFGPSFPGQKGIAHLPDEWMNVDDILQCTIIYAYSLYQFRNE